MFLFKKTKNKKNARNGSRIDENLWKMSGSMQEGPGSPKKNEKMKMQGKKFKTLKKKIEKHVFSDISLYI